MRHVSLTGTLFFVTHLLVILGALSAQQIEPRSLFIEGYANRLSYQAGEEVALHVSTSAEEYSFQVVRLGAQPAVVLSTSGIAGGAEKIPPGKGYTSRACGFDMNRNGIIGEPADRLAGDGKTRDPDGDGVQEDILYVDIPESHMRELKCIDLSYDENEVLETITSIKRKENPYWGM